MPRGVFIRTKPVKGSMGMLGKKHSMETIIKMRGRIPWNKGIAFSDEVRKKQSDSRKKAIMEGRAISWNKGTKGLTGANPGSFKKGHYPTPEQSKMLRERFKGVNNPQWKGGITPIVENIRRSRIYNKWRTYIYKRDNYTCTWCGKHGVELHVDHEIPFFFLIEGLRTQSRNENLYEKAMDYNALWDMINGRTLCVPCHKLTATYGEKAKTYER
jgi:hypothetical protein